MELAPEKLKKKFRTISLAKKRGDESIADIRILQENEAGIYILHLGLTVIEVEAERKIEDLEQEARMIFPQVLYAFK